MSFHLLLINWLNNSFVSNIYVGKDGKLHKVQGGADSVLPFSNFKRYFSDSITLETTSKFFKLGFKPKFIAVNTTWFYDEELNKCWYLNGLNYSVPVGTWTANNLFKFDRIVDNGFYATAYSRDTSANIIAFG